MRSANIARSIRLLTQDWEIPELTNDLANEVGRQAALTTSGGASQIGAGAIAIHIGPVKSGSRVERRAATWSKEMKFIIFGSNPSLNKDLRKHMCEMPAEYHDIIKQFMEGRQRHLRETVDRPPGKAVTTAISTAKHRLDK